VDAPRTLGGEAGGGRAAPPVGTGGMQPRAGADTLASACGGVATAIALGTALFVLYSAQFGLFPSMIQRGVVIAAVLALAYLKVVRDRTRRLPGRLLGLALAVISVAIALFVAFNRDTIALRPTGPTSLELGLGLLLLLIVLDVTRREMGWALPIITVVFVGYAAFGRYMPGIFRHRGVPPEYLVQYLSIEVEGLWGTPVAVAATFIAMFLILGAVLHASGAGRFMIDMAYAVLGRVRGGPAKMAVVASGMFGSVSGSTVANVVATGTFTIPLMQRTGYTPRFAAAVEAAASCGGQLVPPVMGAAAFIMAEVLRVPYAQIAAAALLPALLYYLALFITVDLEAARRGLAGLPRDQLPAAMPLILRRGYVLLPPMRAAFWAIVLAALLAFLDEDIRRRPSLLFRAFAEGIDGLVPVAVACACSGLVIGALVVTGLTVKLSAMLVVVAGDSMAILLLLTMVASIVLGMGLPTVACYILLAVLVAPSLVRMGIEPIAAHLFVFYFGIVSGITPPVAMAAFAGAAIAKSSQMRTGFTALRIGTSAFILPFMFVMGPGLLLQGSVFQIVAATLTASLGIWSLTAAVIGHLGGPLALWQRALLTGAALALIFQDVPTDLLGVAGILVAIGPRMIAWRRDRGVTTGGATLPQAEGAPARRTPNDNPT
jgi:TRAP transporter 4TM/12TM fusion protein